MPVEEQVSLDASRSDALTPAHEPRIAGAAILYRLYDVGYGINLDRAFDRLGTSAPERTRPLRGEAQAIRIANPPLTVGLGATSVAIEGSSHAVELSARVFDFGVASLRATVCPPAGLSWNDFARFGVAVSTSPTWPELFERQRQHLVERIAPAIERPNQAPVTEDYVVFRVHSLTDESGGRLPTEVLDEADVARLLLGETRPLSATARRDLLSPRFTYFEDDLTVMTWNAALVVEPHVEDSDVQYVLEFANAQLLELRYYDAVLDAELPRIYDRIAEARHGFHLLGRRYSRLLATLQTQVADTTELVEGVENSLKVTEDVFLARIYAAALELFRGRAWRSGIDGKLAIVRDAYGMLNAESQARRSEALEVIIILLIVLEVVLTLLRY
ncbi:MAG: hypothetical protein ABIS67_04045 [Candidatus Eisenbacteria bacterium]